MSPTAGQLAPYEAALMVSACAVADERRGSMMPIKFGNVFEMEFEHWTLYVRIGRHALFLCRGLSCID